MQHYVFLLSYKQQPVRITGECSKSITNKNYNVKAIQSAYTAKEISGKATDYTQHSCTCSKTSELCLAVWSTFYANKCHKSPEF